MNYTFNNLKSNNNKESQVIHNMVVGLGNENKRQTIVKGARDRHPIKNSDFDKKGNLFNCQNGTIDLNTFAFTEHNHNDLLSKISNVVYDENAKSER